MTTGVLMRGRRSGCGRPGWPDQVVVATATVDPWRDSPARLRAYQRLTGVDFTQLTGTRGEIRRLWRFFGVSYYRVPQGNPPDVDWLTHRPETFDVQHTDALFLLDPAGQERIADDGMPQVTGHLASRRWPGCSTTRAGRTWLTPQFAWSASDVIDDLYYLMDRNIPVAAPPAKATAPAPAARGPSWPARPRSLAAFHSQAGRLLGLRQPRWPPGCKALRGYPVVDQRLGVLVPAVPQRVPAVRRRRRPVRARGSRSWGSTPTTAPSDARSFLASHPVSYPSYQSSSGRARLAGRRSRRCRRRCSSTAPGRWSRSTRASTRPRATLVDDVQRCFRTAEEFAVQRWARYTFRLCQLTAVRRYAVGGRALTRDETRDRVRTGHGPGRADRRLHRARRLHRPQPQRRRGDLLIFLRRLRLHLRPAVRVRPRPRAAGGRPAVRARAAARHGRRPGPGRLRQGRSGRLWQSAGATGAFVAALGSYGYATRRDLSSWARTCSGRCWR